MIPFIKLPKIIDLLSRLYLNLLSSISYVYFMAIMTFLTQTLLRSSVVSEECILNTSSFISSTISSFHFHALPFFFFLVFPFLGYLIYSTPPHFILILLLLGNSFFPLLYYNSCAFFIEQYCVVCVGQRPYLSLPITTPFHLHHTVESTALKEAQFNLLFI